MFDPLTQDAAELSKAELGENQTSGSTRNKYSAVDSSTSRPAHFDNNKEPYCELKMKELTQACEISMSLSFTKRRPDPPASVVKELWVARKNHISTLLCSSGQPLPATPRFMGIRAPRAY